MSPEPGFRVRGLVHGLHESRPLAEWVADIRDAVGLDLKVEIVLPSGESLSAAEWLAAFEAEFGTRVPGARKET